MFAALRRAWQGYLASIPKTADPEPVSDADIRKALRPPPADQATVTAFNALAACVLSHLSESDRAVQTRKLLARLKPGVSPVEALGAWIHSNSGPKGSTGVIALDWKARDEVLWQALRLCAAHGVSTDWTYDALIDETWQGWQERGETPVDSPLRDFARALQVTRNVLLRFSVDDTVYAFATAQDRRDETVNLCRELGIDVNVGS